MAKVEAKQNGVQRQYALIQSRLNELSYVEASFLFRIHLDDFAAGSIHLEQLLSARTKEELGSLMDPADLDEAATDWKKDLKVTARRLCELSREAVFSADPERLPEEVANQVLNLFRYVGAHIPDAGDSELGDYKRNILSRTLSPTTV